LPTPQAQTLRGHAGAGDAGRDSTSCLRAIPLGLEAARDLNRKLRQTYPALVQAAPNSCSAGMR